MRGISSTRRNTGRRRWGGAAGKFLFVRPGPGVVAVSLPPPGAATPAAAAGKFLCVRPGPGPPGATAGGTDPSRRRQQRSLYLAPRSRSPWAAARGHQVCCRLAGVPPKESESESESEAPSMLPPCRDAPQRIRIRIRIRIRKGKGNSKMKRKRKGE